jgi:hypothetical protein
LSKGRVSYILGELRSHAPFTLFGALLGILFMLLFQRWDESARYSYHLFYVFHPGHVVLSAMVTAAMYKIHSKKPHILAVFLIGYLGSVGVATLSDSLIPYAGEKMLGLHVSPHAHGEHSDEAAHSEEADIGGQGHDLDEGEGLAEQSEEHDEGGSHIGFIEEWYIVNPAALLGILLGYFWPRTKLPHFGHVLLSIWASLFHILMALGGGASPGQWAGIFLFLFIAVWLPCCISDIVFPLLFVKEGCECPHHKH